MAAKVTVDYYGVEGSGRNVTEAKRDAGEKIKTALAGSYTPELVAWRGYAVLVYREPGCWCNRLIADPERGVVPGPVWGTQYQSKEEALRSARAHVADLGWSVEEGVEAVPDLVKGDRELEREWLWKAQFAVRYRAARARGLNDNDAHSYAGRNPARPELWLAEDRATA